MKVSGKKKIKRNHEEGKSDPKFVLEARSCRAQEVSRARFTVKNL